MGFSVLPIAPVPRAGDTNRAKGFALQVVQGRDGLIGAEDDVATVAAIAAIGP